MALASGLKLLTKSLLNPLRCARQALAPNVLLMAKLVALCLLLKGFWLRLPEPFLPFLPFFDYVGSPAIIHRVLQITFVASAASLLFNWHVRTSCLVLGSAILLGILASRPFYQSNRLFCACLLLMAALQRPGRKPWLLRWQVATLYFGAGLNKLADVDWRSGQFFENWVVGLHHQALYTKIAAWLPGLLLSQIMSWATILIELSPLRRIPRPPILRLGDLG
jgi:hypothetical protein